MKKLHCGLCEKDPPQISQIMEHMQEAIDRDGWFEISDCSAFALYQYIERLRNEEEYKVAGEIIDELREKLDDATRLLESFRYDAEDRPKPMSQEFVNRLEALRIGDTVRNFHFGKR